ncbi:lytic transglycosylase domain-containing protein [Alteromonadaceae bacterium BrNp21-10]|nr:lytic transglycosylase domain-containing protein [Alteromonadaceae bacterium BrNp21-10]
MKPYKTVLLICCLLGSTSIQAMTSSQIKQQLISESIEQGLDPALALAIAKVESDFNADVVSHAGAIGVMQIMPATAEQVFGVSRYRLTHPQTNIRLGVQYIKQLLANYDNRLDIALSHYNGGSAVRSKGGSLQVIPATQGYVNKVMHYKKQFTSPINWQPQYNEAPTSNSSFAILTKTNIEEPDDSLTSKVRQLRMHNILRNSPKSLAKKQGLTANQNRRQNKNSKLAKVKQWESIY